MLTNNYSPLVQWLLYMADSNLILSQKNSEWCGHGPILEQDIALTNIALDQLGQARAYYQYASKIIQAETGSETNEDELAFLRDTRAFHNLLLCELPNGDWAQTVAKLFFFSHYQFHLLQDLINHEDETINAIAKKSLKEVAYHVRWSSEWIVRMGDGTAESNRRVHDAIQYLLPYLNEFIQPAPYETELNFYNCDSIKDKMIASVEEVLMKATLEKPVAFHINLIQQKGGKIGLHTEHLGYILAELQFMQRAYPNMEW